MSFVRTGRQEAMCFQLDKSTFDWPRKSSRAWVGSRVRLRITGQAGFRDQRLRDTTPFEATVQWLDVSYCKGVVLCAIPAGCELQFPWGSQMPEELRSEMSRLVWFNYAMRHQHGSTKATRFWTRPTHSYPSPVQTLEYPSGNSIFPTGDDVSRGAVGLGGVHQTLTRWTSTFSDRFELSCANPWVCCSLRYQTSKPCQCQRRRQSFGTENSTQSAMGARTAHQLGCGFTWRLCDLARPLGRLKVSPLWRNVEGTNRPGP